jgi:hypothetical protein
VLATHGAEKSTWMKILRKTAERRCRHLLSKGMLDENLMKAPVYTPDHFFASCQLCATKFTVYKRRHHCRICGKVICGGCSGNKATLNKDKGKKKKKKKKKKGASKAEGKASVRTIDEKKKRVCDVCYRKIQRPETDTASTKATTSSVKTVNTQSEQGMCFWMIYKDFSIISPTF